MVEELATSAAWLVRYSATSFLPFHYLGLAVVVEH